VSLKPFSEVTVAIALQTGNDTRPVETRSPIIANLGIRQIELGSDSGVRDLSLRKIRRSENRQSQQDRHTRTEQNFQGITSVEEMGVEFAVHTKNESLQNLNHLAHGFPLSESDQTGRSPRQNPGSSHQPAHHDNPAV